MSRQLKPLLRNCLISAAGAMLSIVLFGLMLTLLWQFTPPHTTSQLVTALIAAALAITASSYLVAKFYPGRKILSGLLFSVVLSLVSFGYILGIQTLLLVFVTAGGLLGLLGGYLAQGSKRSIQKTS